jgi:hypothetical protein
MRTVEKHVGLSTGQTHLPDWICAAVLNKLDAQDARLLAKLLNDANGDSRCYFFDGSWVVDSLYPRYVREDPEATSSDG